MLAAMQTRLPPQRLRGRGTARPDGAFVLYWMVAARRTRWNFGLQRAVECARALERPLLVLEPLRCGYRWASDRLHRFVLQGMADNRAACAAHGVAYHPYVEPEPGAGRGLLAALAEQACLVVTDESPAFFLPHLLAAAVAKLPGRLEAADSNGLLPLRAADRSYPTAYAFRRFLQRVLPEHLPHAPGSEPLEDAHALPALAELPPALRTRWPAASEALLAAEAGALAVLPIDHAVPPAPAHGGPVAAGAVLASFLARRLQFYASERHQPEIEAASGLSPWLHFGHIAAHEVFDALARREHWSPSVLVPGGRGAREGWWRMSPEAEAYLDQLVTWRELGFNLCAREPRHAEYETLPDWARATLQKHAGDPRPQTYTLAQFEAAATHDPLWNAAQNQLRREGRIHNHLRMLWGKKVLHWAASPQEAFAILFVLNDKYALDGRDPNSSSGIAWCFGRYDRPWGPERPIFGTVRYMTSENTARKLRVKAYVRRWNGGDGAHAG